MLGGPAVVGRAGEHGPQVQRCVRGRDLGRPRDQRARQLVAVAVAVAVDVVVAGVHDDVQHRRPVVRGREERDTRDVVAATGQHDLPRRARPTVPGEPEQLWLRQGRVRLRLAGPSEEVRHRCLLRVVERRHLGHYKVGARVHDGQGNPVR